LPPPESRSIFPNSATAAFPRSPRTHLGFFPVIPCPCGPLLLSRFLRNLRCNGGRWAVPYPTPVSRKLKTFFLFSARGLGAASFSFLPFSFADLGTDSQLIFLFFLAPQFSYRASLSAVRVFSSLPFYSLRYPPPLFRLPPEGDLLLDSPLRSDSAVSNSAPHLRFTD